jgi:mono/diheme cytochrome c family protein
MHTFQPHQHRARTMPRRTFVPGVARLVMLGIALGIGLVACAPDPAPGSASSSTRAAVAMPSLSAPGDARPATPGDWPSRYALGRTASYDQVSALDTDVDTTGAGLPAGHGTAAEGATVFAAKCAVCHGPAGEGVAPNPPLVKALVTSDSFPWATNAAYPKTVGNYWPFATTLYAYIRHAMPFTQPGSLSPTETYQVVAFLLAENGVIPRETVLDARSLPAVHLPLRSRFVLDTRRGGAEVR